MHLDFKDLKPYMKEKTPEVVEYGVNEYCCLVGKMAHVGNIFQVVLKVLYALNVHILESFTFDEEELGKPDNDVEMEDDDRWEDENERIQDLREMGQDAQQMIDFV